MVCVCAWGREQVMCVYMLVCLAFSGSSSCGSPHEICSLSQSGHTPPPTASASAHAWERRKRRRKKR